MANEFNKRLAQYFANSTVRHNQINETQKRKTQRQQANDQYFNNYIAPPIARYAIVPEAHQQLLTMRMCDELFLLVLDGQFEPTEVAFFLFVFEQRRRILVVMIEYDF